MLSPSLVVSLVAVYLLFLNEIVLASKSSNSNSNSNSKGKGEDRLDCISKCRDSPRSTKSSSSSASSQWQLDTHIHSSYINPDCIEDSSDSFQFTFSQTFSLQLSLQADVKVPLNITLDQAFQGGAVNITYSKVKLKPFCDSNKQVCPRCLGKRYLSISSYSSIGDCVCSTIPCPRCVGTGVTFPPACRPDPFEKSVTMKEVKLPVGVASGQEFVFKGEGNTIYNDHGVKVGDLKVVVEGYEPAIYWFDQPSQALVYNVSLSPLEVIYGFNRTLEYYNSTSMFVDRDNQITLPMFNITIPCKGPPISDAVIDLSMYRLVDSSQQGFEVAVDGDDAELSKIPIDKNCVVSVLHVNDTLTPLDASTSKLHKLSDLTLLFDLEEDSFQQPDFNGTVVIDGNTTMDGTDLQKLLDKAGEMAEYYRLRRVVAFLQMRKSLFNSARRASYPTDTHNDTSSEENQAADDSVNNENVKDSFETFEGSKANAESV